MLSYNAKRYSNIEYYTYLSTPLLACKIRNNIAIFRVLIILLRHKWLWYYLVVQPKIKILTNKIKNSIT